MDDVSDDSPASAAGVQLGDQLCRFGDVSWDGGDASSVLPKVRGGNTPFDVFCQLLFRSYVVADELFFYRMLMMN